MASTSNRNLIHNFFSPTASRFVDSLSTLKTTNSPTTRNSQNVKFFSPDVKQSFDKSFVTVAVNLINGLFSSTVKNFIRVSSTSTSTRKPSTTNKAGILRNAIQIFQNPELSLNAQIKVGISRSTEKSTSTKSNNTEMITKDERKANDKKKKNQKILNKCVANKMEDNENAAPIILLCQIRFADGYFNLDEKEKCIMKRLKKRCGNVITTGVPLFSNTTSPC